jgi:hypothetical protein
MNKEVPNGPKDETKRDETKQEEPKTVLVTETGEYDLTNILALAFGSTTQTS